MAIIILIAIILIVLAVKKLVPMSYALKATRAYGEGDVEKAAALYKKAAASGNIAHRLNYALMLMRCGKMQDAETVFNDIVFDRGVILNDKIRAKLYRCMLYEKTDRLDDALEDAEEIFENVKNTTVYGVLGYLRQKKGGAELEFCLEAYDYNSDDRDICDNLTVAYIRSGELDKAKELADSIRERFPAFIEGFYRSAVIAKMMGDIPLAIKFLEEAKNCTRNALTTISEEEIEMLREELNNA